MKLLKVLLAYLASIIITTPLWVGVAEATTVTGTISAPSSTYPLADATITFTLSQGGIVPGSYVLSTSPIVCGTDSSGSIIGITRPVIIATGSINLASGSLAAGTYYVRLTYWNASGETQVSPETSFTLASPGTLTVNSPALRPTDASGYRVYVGTSAGTGTRQSSVTGWANQSYASSLSAGASAPSSNTTTCTPQGNDAIIPTDTTYKISVVDSGARSVPGFSQPWYLTSSSINVTNNYPIAANRTARFPLPIFANPASNATQSVNSPLTLNGYFLTVGAMVLPNNASPPTTAIGKTIIYTDNSGVAKVCPNGSACQSLIGSGGGLSGTTGKIPKFTSGSTIGDSNVTEDTSGTAVLKVNERLLVNATSSDVTTGSQVNVGQLNVVNSTANAQRITITAFGGGSGYGEIASTFTGSGSYKPLVLAAGGNEVLRLTADPLIQLTTSFAGATPVSASGTVALRNNNGTLEVSQNGGAWSSIGGGGSSGNITYGTLSPDTRPGSPATGSLFIATDFNHIYRYTGSAWIWIDGGNDYIGFFKAAPGTGWTVCDGSTVTHATSSGGTASITAPNMTAGTFPYSNGTYTGPTATAAAAPTENAHSHGVGSLFTSASGGSDSHGAMSGGDFNAAGNAHVHVVGGSTASSTATINTDGLPQREGFLCYLRL